MAEELQHLLERIQKEGVEKAKREAEQIVSAARAEAARLVAESEKEAAAITADAEKEADAFRERATRSLKQSARDVVLSVGVAISAALRRLVERETKEAMGPEILQQMLARFVEAYCAEGSGAGRVELLVSPEDQESVTQYMTSAFAEALRSGVDIKADEGVVAGFRATLVDRHVQHDFTSEAATEAICTLLRPMLADIVREEMASEPKPSAE